MSEQALETLEPRLVWERFLELTRIARPPKEEAAARRHVLDWAVGQGFAATVDDARNAVVRVPASEGRDAAPTVVLQAHMDMVCERDPDSQYDPREGRIKVVLDDDWVAAEGTTLGADNGIGVAGAMAVAEDQGVSHGPLELLFTVSEEQGLEGAKALDPELLSGRVLLNLDGTSDGGLTIGCAGSIHTFTRLPLSLEAMPDGRLGREIRVVGARGGHSGEDIAAGRVNANKALGRVLSRARERAPIALALLEGGVSRNAIPREARAIVTLPVEDEPALRQAVDEELSSLREEFAQTDPGVAVAIEPRRTVTRAAGEASTSRVLDLLLALPSGVLTMHPELAGVVETSTSLNVVRTEDKLVTLASMTRSANAAALESALATIQATARLAGAEVEVVRSYPPWRPDLESRLLQVARKTFERVFDAEPQLTVVHGGLECAVIGGKVPGIEMISIGPEIEGPHAPGERLSVSSTQRFYRFLAALLDDLSR